ncbi:MAG: V-type ATP synthase subunit E [Sarcina sp.]
MSNLQQITSKIKKDAEVQKEIILTEAMEKATVIINKKKSAADKDAADLIEKSKKEAIKKAERVLSGATLKVRNDKLVAKQKMIDEVFVLAKEKLCSMSNTELLKFIEAKILNSNIVGDETLIISQKDQKVITQEFVDILNKELKSINKLGELTISNEFRNFDGGFIIEKNGIEVNNTFDSLVEALREEMEFEIANIMFN